MGRTLRAGIALTLASGHTLATMVPPPVIAELVAASADFLAAEPWERFDSEALLLARVDGVFKGNGKMRGVEATHALVPAAALRATASNEQIGGASAAKCTARVELVGAR